MCFVEHDYPWLLRRKRQNIENWESFCLNQIKDFKISQGVYCLSVHLFKCLYFCLFVYLSVRLFICMSVCLSICLIRLSLLSNCLYFCLYVLLPFGLFLPKTPISTVYTLYRNTLRKAYKLHKGKNVFGYLLSVQYTELKDQFWKFLF